MGPQSFAEGLYIEGHWWPSASVSYAEGLCYADGHRVSTEGCLRRRAALRAAVGVLYAEGFRPSAYGWIPVVDQMLTMGNLKE
jgi:hypothetical protein